MKKITDKKYISRLTLLCVAAYLVSYLTRKNFAAILAEFTVAEGIEKSAASIITVSLFIFYGIGQLLSGFLGDKLSPRKILTFGLGLTTVINVIMPFMDSNITVMAVLWGINGIAQAFMWPPMVKIMTSRFTSEVYKESVLKVSIGSAAGTMLVYGLAAAFIRLFESWRPIFFFSAACSAIMTVVWFFGVGHIEEYADKNGTEFEEALPVKPGSKRALGFNAFTMSPIIPIMIAIVFQGMLRDGIEQWMPSYLSEGYGIETSGAVLSAVVLPILTMVCMKLTSYIYGRCFKNELTCSAVIFAVGTVSSLLLYILHGKNTVAAVALTAIIASAMHGVNLILICMIPKSYEKHGNVSFISGMINFCTYIGSAIFTYGIAKFSEVWDWKTTVLSWTIAAAIGTLICAVTIIPWRRFTNKDNMEEK